MRSDNVAFRICEEYEEDEVEMLEPDIESRIVGLKALRDPRDVSDGSKEGGREPDVGGL